MLTVKEKGLLLSIIKHCERIGETVPDYQNKNSIQAR